MSQICVSSFPTEILTEIGSYLNWDDIKALSYVSSRFFHVFSRERKTLKSLSIKGNDYFSDLFIIDVVLPNGMKIRYRLESSWGITEIFRHIWGPTGEYDLFSIRVWVEGRDTKASAIGIFDRFMDMFGFDELHIHLQTFISRLNEKYSSRKVNTLGIAYGPDFYNCIYKLQPINLIIFPSDRGRSNAFSERIDLKRLHRLNNLKLNEEYILKIEDFLESHIPNFTFPASTMSFTMEHVKTIIDRWRKGTHKYEEIILYKPEGFENVRLEFGYIPGCAFKEEISHQHIRTLFIFQNPEDRWIELRINQEMVRIRLLDADWTEDKKFTLDSYCFEFDGYAD